MKTRILFTLLFLLCFVGIINAQYQSVHTGRHIDSTITNVNNWFSFTDDILTVPGGKQYIYMGSIGTPLGGGLHIFGNGLGVPVLKAYSYAGANTAVGLELGVVGTNGNNKIIRGYNNVSVTPTEVFYVNGLGSVYLAGDLQVAGNYSDFAIQPQLLDDSLAAKLNRSEYIPDMDSSDTFIGSTTVYVQADTSSSQINVVTPGGYLQLSSSGIAIQGTVVNIGDVDENNNKTKITIDDTAETIYLASTTGNNNVYFDGANGKFIFTLDSVGVRGNLDVDGFIYLNNTGFLFSQGGNSYFYTPENSIMYLGVNGGTLLSIDAASDTGFVFSPGNLGKGWSILYKGATGSEDLIPTEDYRESIGSSLKQVKNIYTHNLIIDSAATINGSTVIIATDTISFRNTSNSYYEPLGVTLDEIGDLAVPKTFTLGTNDLIWNVTNSGKIEINTITAGADLEGSLHIHQHTGNPLSASRLTKIESEDVDVVPLEIQAVNSDTAIWVSEGKIYTAEDIVVNSSNVLVASDTVSTIATKDDLTGIVTDTTHQVLSSNVVGTPWSVFYTDGSGSVIDLSLGGSGTVLKSNGPSSAPTWQTDATGSGGASYADSVSHDGRHVTGDSLTTIAEVVALLPGGDTDSSDTFIGSSVIYVQADTSNSKIIINADSARVTSNFDVSGVLSLHDTIVVRDSNLVFFKLDNSADDSPDYVIGTYNHDDGNGGLTDRTLVYGINIGANGARVDTNEASFAFEIESNYWTGSQYQFEPHWTFTDENGITRKVLSGGLGKTTGYTALDLNVHKLRIKNADNNNDYITIYADTSFGYGKNMIFHDSTYVNFAVNNFPYLRQQDNTAVYRSLIYLDDNNVYRVGESGANNAILFGADNNQMAKFSQAGQIFLQPLYITQGIYDYATDPDTAMKLYISSPGYGFIDVNFLYNTSDQFILSQDNYTPYAIFDRSGGSLTLGTTNTVGTGKVYAGEYYTSSTLGYLHTPNDSLVTFQDTISVIATKSDLVGVVTDTTHKVSYSDIINPAFPDTNGVTNGYALKKQDGSLYWGPDATGSGGAEYADSITHNGRHVTGDSLMTIEELVATFEPLGVTVSDVTDLPDTLLLYQKLADMSIPGNEISDTLLLYQKTIPNLSDTTKYFEQYDTLLTLGTKTDLLAKQNTIPNLSDTTKYVEWTDTLNTIATKDDIVGIVTDTSHYVSIPKVIFLQDSLDDKLNRSEYNPTFGDVDSSDTYLGNSNASIQADTANGVVNFAADSMVFSDGVLDPMTMKAAGGQSGLTGLRIGETIQLYGDNTSVGFYQNGQGSDLNAPSGMSGDWDWNLPDKNGNIALTSDIADSIAANSDTLSYTASEIDSLLGLAGTALQNIVEDTTPQLGGDLDMNGHAEVLYGETWNGSVSAGELVYFTGSEWDETDASADTTSGGVWLGIAVNTTDILIRGYYTTSGLTAGDEYYLSETEGAWTNTKPTTSSSVKRVIGYAHSTTQIYFNPSSEYTVHN